MVDKARERDTVLGESSECHIFFQFLFIFAGRTLTAFGSFRSTNNITRGYENEET